MVFIAVRLIEAAETIDVTLRSCYRNFSLNSVTSFLKETQMGLE
jgi:hypothetical protein